MSSETYEVGYGKPPITTRFRKGQSGNPSGRPKKASQLLDPGIVLETIDNEEIVVIDRGKPKRMTMVEIQFRQSFTKAIRGDLKMARLVVDMATKYFGSEGRGASGYEFMGATEAMQRFGPKWQERINELNARLGYRR